jgi:hypothetical protein
MIKFTQIVKIAEKTVNKSSPVEEQLQDTLYCVTDLEKKKA